MGCAGTAQMELVVAVSKHKPQLWRERQALHRGAVRDIDTIGVKLAYLLYLPTCIHAKPTPIADTRIILTIVFFKMLQYKCQQ